MLNVECTRIKKGEILFPNTSIDQNTLKNDQTLSLTTKKTIQNDDYDDERYSRSDIGEFGQARIQTVGGIGQAGPYGAWQYIVLCSLSTGHTSCSLFSFNRLHRLWIWLRTMTMPKTMDRLRNSFLWNWHVWKGPSWPRSSNISNIMLKNQWKKSHNHSEERHSMRCVYRNTAVSFSDDPHTVSSGHDTRMVSNICSRHVRRPLVSSSHSSQLYGDPTLVGHGVFAGDVSVARKVGRRGTLVTRDRECASREQHGLTLTLFSFFFYEPLFDGLH